MAMANNDQVLIITLGIIRIMKNIQGNGDGDNNTGDDDYKDDDKTIGDYGQ